MGGSPAAGLPGTDLWRLAAAPPRERTVFSEYHAVGSAAASFMLRDGRYKYLYYVDAPPQLFDLATDPEERHDLAAAGDARAPALLRRFERELRALLDPEAVDRRAKAGPGGTGGGLRRARRGAGARHLRQLANPGRSANLEPSRHVAIAAEPAAAEEGACAGPATRLMRAGASRRAVPTAAGRRRAGNQMRAWYSYSSW